ncbi:MAG TPA: deoxyribonuclease IV [Candidatus Dormibacteraeota bacterium]|nr:deoxyribonuclease IV [Candidatus Dormibacteraeota bacterium]
MTEQKISPVTPEQPIVQPPEFDPEDEYRPEPEPEPLPPAWMDGSFRIGIHTSIAGNYLNALESARKLGCNALQIFSASPRMWQGGSARIPDVDAQAFRVRREELRLGPLVIHANYLINLASEQRMLQTRSIQAFHDEIVRAMALGADFLVVHPGARGEATTEQAISTIVESVKQASKRAPMGGLRILIENTAGMGTAVGARLEEVGEILAGLRNLPVGACLDTAHLFAAGYDIKSEGGLASTIGQIDGAIGLENVPVIHLNDSKIPLGGRVDRHEHIGKGKIGAAAFARILRHPRFGTAAPEGLTGRVFVAETPIDDPGDDRRNVARLWELAGLQEQAPAAEKGFSMLTAALQKKISIHRKAEKKRSAATETQRTPKRAAKKARTKKGGARKSSARQKRG